VWELLYHRAVTPGLEARIGPDTASKGRAEHLVVDATTGRPSILSQMLPGIQV
jgi:hypothetical protein